MRTLTVVLCLISASAAYAQKAGNFFDRAFQREAMRSFVGPQALCQERTASSRHCKYEKADHDIEVHGTDTGLVAHVSIRIDDAETGANIVRLIKLAASYGFDLADVRDCLRTALEMGIRISGQGSSERANDSFWLTCRGMQSTLTVDLKLRPSAPKNDF